MTVTSTVRIPSAAMTPAAAPARPVRSPSAVLALLSAAIGMVAGAFWMGLWDRLVLVTIPALLLAGV